MAQSDAGHYVLLNPQLKSKPLPARRAPSGAERAKQLRSAYCEFARDVVQTSLAVDERATSHGLTDALLDAYNAHADVVLRPDDLWLAAAHAFACQVLSDPPRYRNVFVEHAGQKELEVNMTGAVGGDLRGDWTGFAARICALIDDSVRSDEARALLAALRPDFSTTTELDRSLAQMLAMCSMQEYFSYKVTLDCGLRGVRLMGTVADWERLIDKTRALSAALPGFDWYFEHIRPVLELMLATRRLDPATMTYEPIDVEFEARKGASAARAHLLRAAQRAGGAATASELPYNFDLPPTARPEDIRRMWNRMATHYQVGSGGDVGYSGWIVLLCPFDISFDRQTKTRRVARVADGMRDTLSTQMCSVPVLVDDNGVEHKMVIAVGHAGVRTCDGGFAPVAGYVIGRRA